jgi:spore coat polysaccharide biosynthesis protein SpsF (cytidylyltransferase family)
MNNKTAIIIQARTGSKRLPGKVLKMLTKKLNVLEFLVKRMKFSQNIKKIIIATSNLKRDEKILKINCKNIFFFQGSERNVLKRYIDAANKFKIKHIIRITADCPFADPFLIDIMIRKYHKSKFNYVSNVTPPSFPNGFDIEIFSLKLAKKSLSFFKNSKNKEHVTYAMRNKNMSKILKIKSYNFSCYENLNHQRLTLDNIKDFKIIKKLANKINISDNWEKIYIKYKKL